jgi:hypothetical protein
MASFGKTERSERSDRAELIGRGDRRALASGAIHSVVG